MLDYLLALLKTLFNSLFILASRLPALEWLKDWIGAVVDQLGPAAGFLLLSAAAIFGTLAVALFFWVLRRNPERGRRARILAEVLPFQHPASSHQNVSEKEDPLAG